MYIIARISEGIVSRLTREIEVVFEPCEDVVVVMFRQVTQLPVSSTRSTNWVRVHWFKFEHGKDQGGDSGTNINKMAIEKLLPQQPRQPNENTARTGNQSTPGVHELLGRVRNQVLISINIKDKRDFWKCSDQKKLYWYHAILEVKLLHGTYLS